MKGYMKQATVVAKGSMILSCAVWLAACGGSGSSSSDDTAGSTYEPEPTSLAGIQVVDADNTPLDDATVEVVPAEDLESETATIQAVAAGNQGTFFPGDAYIPDDHSFPGDSYVQTDTDGNADLDLDHGEWWMKTTKAGGTSYQFVVVAPENAAENSTFRASLSCAGGSCHDQSEEAIIGSLAGVVYNGDGPIEGAQVSLSGGAATNGAYATATTDEHGHYVLTFNLNKNLAEALEESTLSATAAGHQGTTKTIAVASGNATGANLALTPTDGAEEGDVLWHETFETDSDTVAAWQVDGGHDDTDVGYTGWQLLEGGQHILNSLVNVNVKLAPDDPSEGIVPDPVKGSRAYWYGNPATGNFLGAVSSTGPFDDGGTGPAHGGTLTSPAIDLSQVEEGTAISLTFRTWWEIESVNPNEHGYDLMSIQVSTDGGDTFETIARLNPLSDPSSSLDRAPLPYTNYGFNAAPGWLHQEPIAVDDLAGLDEAYLRFEFRTMDGYYNGFRGWLVDDVMIRKGEGTFPLWEGFDWDSALTEDELEQLCAYEPQHDLCNPDDTGSTASLANVDADEPESMEESTGITIVPGRTR